MRLFNYNKIFLFFNVLIVQREIKLQFQDSDMTWLVFVSTPTPFVCSNTPLPPPDPNAPILPPGVLPKAPPGGFPSAFFELRATAPMLPAGVVRIALVNNCTTGQSPIFCPGGGGGPLGHGPARNSLEYENLIRQHAEVYPSGAANIEFSFVSEDKSRNTSDDVASFSFNWAPVTMSSGNTPREDFGPNIPTGNVTNGDYHMANRPSEVNSNKSSSAPNKPNEVSALLMFALPHHQEAFQSALVSNNTVLSIGCIQTLHGLACPTIGHTWNMKVELHPVNFESPNDYEPALLHDIREALLVDLKYELPLNYQKGAGDTYFSGKMIAKLARIVQIGTEIAERSKHLADFLTKYHPLHVSALNRLRSGVEIWLNGSALSPLVYDESWGGLVGCGCDYDGDTSGCFNTFPDCPALVDAGQNYGSGFYNDHHYHYGYHIYAAAILTKLDPIWGRKFYNEVMVLIRDIANPSESDPFFPMWRHKDCKCIMEL